VSVRGTDTGDIDNCRVIPRASKVGGAAGLGVEAAWAESL
jgi:hypothetical protein